ncbi:MAG: hypothetical protein R2873_15895 [Caldilineaceae bacterium]
MRPKTVMVSAWAVTERRRLLQPTALAVFHEIAPILHPDHRVGGGSVPPVGSMPSILAMY